CDGHVIDLPRGDPARHETLRAVRERRFHVRRRGVALDIPEELVEVAAGAAVAIRRTLAGRAVAPALASARALDALDRGFQLSLSLRAPRDVAETGSSALGELQRMVETLAPAAEVDRLSFACRLLL